MLAAKRMMIQVRPVRVDEYEEAGRATALAYEEFVDGEDWQRYLEQLADVGSRAGAAMVLVAVREDRILGSVTLHMSARAAGEPQLAAHEANVRMLGVIPEERGKGIGKLLMNECIRLAAQEGKKVLTLNTTERMRPAQKMYEAMGFIWRKDRILKDGFRLLSYELRLGGAARKRQ